jgi:hypothetical protein
MPRLLTLSLLATLLCAALAPRAEAFPPLLREPGPKPWFAGFNYGGALGARYPCSGVGCSAPSWSQFKIALEGGVHFSRRADGPALAFLSFQAGFGNDYKTIELGPRFFWDIQLVKGLGLYLSPGAMIGYVGWFPSAGSNESGLSFQLSLDGKLVFTERVFVLFRPFALDFMGMSLPSGMSLFLRYDFLLGVGMLF